MPGNVVVDDVRRRVHQQIHGHRGRNGEPLYRIRTKISSRAWSSAILLWRREAA